MYLFWAVARRRMTPPAFVKLAPQGTRPRTMQKQLRYHRAAAFGSTAGSRLECLDVEHAANEREPAARRPAPHNQLDADGTAGPAHRTALHGVPVFEGGRWVHKRREGGRKLEAHHQPGAFPGAFPDVSFRAMLQKKNEAAALQHAEPEFMVKYHEPSAAARGMGAVPGTPMGSLRGHVSLPADVWSSVQHEAFPPTPRPYRRPSGLILPHTPRTPTTPPRAPLGAFRERRRSTAAALATWRGSVEGVAGRALPSTPARLDLSPREQGLSPSQRVELSDAYRVELEDERLTSWGGVPWEEPAAPRVTTSGSRPNTRGEEIPYTEGMMLDEKRHGFVGLVSPWDRASPERCW